MKLLLDTHIFLWFISGDRRLPLTLRDAIRNQANEVYLSVISMWEAIVKYQLGKLPLPESPAHYLPVQRQHHRIVDLPLDEISVAHLTNLPLLHNDPFDRMLVCQALTHGLTLVSVDENVLAYSVPVLSR